MKKQLESKSTNRKLGVVVCGLIKQRGITQKKEAQVKPGKKAPKKTVEDASMNPVKEASVNPVENASMNPDKMMTQIAIFSNVTIADEDVRQWVKNPMTINDLQQKVNEFLADNNNKIIVKDIKYTTQYMNDQQQRIHPGLIVWTVMIIYETKEVLDN